MATRGVCEGLLEADVSADVLAPIDGDLHLRKDIHIGACVRSVVVRSEDLDHGREETAEAAVGRHGVPDGCAEEEAARRLTAVGGDIGPELKLQESSIANELVVRCERFECRRACAKTTVAVTRGQKKSTLHTED